MISTRSRFVRALALVWGLGACGDGGGNGTPADAPPPGDVPPDDGETPDDGNPVITNVAFRQPVEVTLETRLTRLTHTQYQHTVQDLLGVRDSLDLTFAPDALNGFSFDTSNDFRVDARLGPQYRASAERLAERVVTEPDVFARVVTCDPSAAGCGEQFVSDFGERAFRRPLSDEELASFRELFDLGGSLVQSGDAFRDGVQLVVEALLQSPQFLYRAEAGLTSNGSGRLTLDDWEIASRLSYFLYDSMPDEELFAAARAGALHTPEQIEAAARRMLTQPRVLDKLVSFHEQAWQFGRFSRISPDPATYPGLPSGLVTRVRSASAAFVDEVVASGGGLTELLTAPYAFADDGLAPLYGMSAGSAAPGELFRVDFAEGERRGLLMQVGFLASNAYSIRTDPIHRGLFVLRDLLCRQIPDPPPGASMTPLPPTDEPIETTREEISLLTGQSFCPSCHSHINPPGFAFEGFDAVGQVRTEENGVPVDTASEMVLDGRVESFAGPHELVELLARSGEAHRCYASRWIEFAFGRPLSVEDISTWTALSAESLPIADIVATLVRSPQFASLSETGLSGAPAAEAAP